MIPRVHVAALPTPVEPLPRLSAALGGPSLWVKRDDLTGLAFGGNKTRKLEFFIADAQTEGCQTLITTGAVQSNHCRQTAALAARFGLACVLVLYGTPPERVNGNLLLDELLGAEIVWTSREDRDEALQATYERALAAGRRPYLIPYGASNALGAYAYALAMEEFLGQNQPADWIVHASSSGGTQAGLAFGARRAGWPGKILGISVDEPAEILRPRVLRITAELSNLLSLPNPVTAEDVLVDDAHRGQGYAVMSEPERQAIRTFARLEGLLLDPVYSGRAAAALLDLIAHRFFRAEDKILFWHTGGTPALFASPYAAGLLEEGA